MQITITEMSRQQLLAEIRGLNSQAQRLDRQLTACVKKQEQLYAEFLKRAGKQKIYPEYDLSYEEENKLGSRSTWIFNFCQKLTNTAGQFLGTTAEYTSAFNTLEYRLQQLIILRHGLSLTDAEIGTRVALTTSAISAMFKRLKMRFTQNVKRQRLLESFSVRCHTDRQVQQVLNTAIEEIISDNRSLNGLRNYGIQTIGQLVLIEEPELCRFRNIGKKSRNFIKEGIYSVGLRLGMKPENFHDAEGIARLSDVVEKLKKET